MTALEYMEKQLNRHRNNYERELLRNVPEDMLCNIELKIGYYEKTVEALRIGDVVRCKECKYYKKVRRKKTLTENGEHYIWKCVRITGVHPRDDDFCSRGERKHV